MNFDRDNIFYSGIPLPQLYYSLSSERIRTSEFKNGVLLYLCSPEFMKFSCNVCSKERAACVHDAHGYILHDAGDAILAMWVEENLELSDTLSLAVRCALHLVDLCKIQRIDHDSKRPFGIVISVGRFFTVTSGPEDSQVCLVIGPAVDELLSAEVLAEHADVIFSPEAWRLCHRHDLTVEHIQNKEAVKVRSIREQPRVLVDDMNCYNYDNLLTKYPRRAYLLTKEDRENIIRKYMTRTALDKINETWHWHDLPEIWPTTIMFVILQFVQIQTDLKGSHDNVSRIVAEQVFSCGGEICDSFFFEEGCIFLCVVGLPDDERQDKTTHAVQAAYQIHEMCVQETNTVSNISIGVTTGRVMYNLVQLPFRKEFKVIGNKVILAANLTGEYPGIVSCDVATKLYSLLPLSSLMPQGTISHYEDVRYYDEILQLFTDEAAVSSSVMEGRRLALAHMQTMRLDERLVVKYASIIGHTFTTEMLLNILPQMSEEDLTIPLRNLFRAGIFKCASKTCGCQNSQKEVLVGDVWECRLISFCNSEVMEKVHNLIQRNHYVFQLLHVKCATYLQKKNYRCSKCEAKKFTNGHKATQKNYLQEIYNTIRPYEVFKRQGTHSQNKMNSTEGNGNDTENFLAKVKSELTLEPHRMTAGSCECARLVETVLIPRLRHWRYIGDVAKTFDYLVESAAAYVYLQNDAKALEYLTEARSILENLQEGKLAFPSANPGGVEVYDVQHAFVYRFIGEILYKAGKILEAEKNFKRTLTLLDCSLPCNSVVKSFKFIYEKTKKLQYRSRQFELPERTMLDRLQECVNCLSFLWQISYMRGQHRNASLAITMEINLAIQSADPFKILYSAIDYLKYCQLVGKLSTCRRLEAFLCSTCACLSDHPEGRNLINHLTQTLAVIKLCTGDLEQSVKCMLQAQQLSEVLKTSVMDVRTIAVLHLPLLLTARYRESVQQILTLERLSKEMSSSVAEGWFYAVCMNFLLYAGFAFRPFEDCLAFMEKSSSDTNLETDKSLILHLFSAVALWYARLANWAKFAVFFDKAYEVYAQISTSIESISGVVMLLECSVLLFKKELNERNPQIRITLKRTHKLFSSFTQQFGKNNIFTPRVLHLNAYLHQMTRSKMLVQSLRKEAQLLCEKQGNLLDQTWIRQSQADWYDTNSITPAEWSTAVLSMPSWDKAAMLQPEDLLKYRFHLENVEIATPSRISVEICKLFSST